MNIVERWSETESEGEKAIVGGKHWGWKEGDNNDDRQSEETRTRRGMVGERRRGTIALRSPLGRSTPEEEYARARSDNRTNGKERARQSERKIERERVRGGMTFGGTEKEARERERETSPTRRKRDGTR